MGRNKIPIARKLFRTYVFLIGVCILVLLVGTIFYSGFLIYRNIAKTQKQLNRNINQNIENYFQEMNDFSKNLVKNKTFQQTALNKLPSAYHQGKNTAGFFSSLYVEAYEMIQKNYQLGILTEGGDYIWMGSEYCIRELEEDVFENYQDYAMDGSMEIKHLEKGAYLEKGMEGSQAALPDSSKIMLSRSFGGDGFLNNEKSILEIQVEVEEFEKEIQVLSAGKKNMGFQLYILNKEGEEIFSDADFDAGAFLDKNGWKNGNYKHAGGYVYVYPVLDNNLYVLYTVSFFEYYNRLLWFVLILLGYFLFVVAGITGVSYHVVQQISKPINRICGEIWNIDLEKGSRYQPVDTEILELDLLSDSIEQLNIKLEESLNHILMLKEHETQSKMLALQSQMQPHFLVNTLMTIGTMAEEEGNQEIFQMCMDLTKMFRYISLEEKNGVWLFEEVQYVEQYMGIMRRRFPNARTEIDIPISMMQVRIPKMTLQPLVENAFKHSDRNRLFIKVKGTMEEDGHFIIKVSDNGMGFTEKQAGDILEKCRNSMEGINSLSVKVNGMGLVNVYVRLHLFYKEDAVFRLGQEGVTIGGKA